MGIKYKHQELPVAEELKEYVDYVISKGEYFKSLMDIAVDKVNDIIHYMDDIKHEIEFLSSIKLERGLIIDKIIKLLILKRRYQDTLTLCKNFFQDFKFDLFKKQLIASKQRIKRTEKMLADREYTKRANEEVVAELLEEIGNIKLPQKIKTKFEKLKESMILDDVDIEGTLENMNKLLDKDII